MSPRNSLPAPRSAIARARIRRRERGAALFLVVLVATMLIAVGLYAARSATLATASSGHLRQATQARYLAEYALFASTGTARRVPREVRDKATRLDNIKKLDCKAMANTKESMQSCYRVDVIDMKDKLSKDAKTPLTPDSVGDAAISGVFRVELTDWKKLREPPQPGYDERFKFQRATATAWSRVARDASATAEYSQSSTMARGYVRVGPIAD